MAQQDVLFDVADRPSRSDIMDELHNRQGYPIGKVDTLVRMYHVRDGWRVEVYGRLQGAKNFNYMGQILMAQPDWVKGRNIPDHERHLMALQCIRALVDGRNGVTLGAVEGKNGWSKEDEATYTWEVQCPVQAGTVAMLCTDTKWEAAWQFVNLV